VGHGGAVEDFGGYRKSLFQGFWVAGVVDAVKVNFVPISGDMRL